MLKAEFQPRTFSSGCNDAFSVFGFLAFLLALLDLILELNMSKKRRKRFTPSNFVEDGQKIIQEWSKESTFNKNEVFSGNYWENINWDSNKNRSLNKVRFTLIYKK